MMSFLLIGPEADSLLSGRVVITHQISLLQVAFLQTQAFGGVATEALVWLLARHEGTLSPGAPLGAAAEELALSEAAVCSHLIPAGLGNRLHEYVTTDKSASMVLPRTQNAERCCKPIDSNSMCGDPSERCAALARPTFSPDHGPNPTQSSPAPRCRRRSRGSGRRWPGWRRWAGWRRRASCWGGTRSGAARSTPPATRSCWRRWGCKH